MNGRRNGSQNRVTSSQYQAQKNRERQQEYAQDDLRQYHTQNQLLHAGAASEDRSDLLRRQKRTQQMNAELRRGYEIDQYLKEKERRRVIAEQDAQLAQALSDMKAKENSRAMTHQRVIDEADEIKELKARLEAARLTKERKAQQLEMDLRSQREREERRIADNAFEQERKRAAAEEQARHEKQLEAKQRNMQLLQEQMAERERNRQEAYEAYLKEKDEVDAVVATLAAKEQQEQEKKKALAEQTRREISQYLQERSRLRAAEAARAKAELDKIMEHQRLQQERQAEIMRQKNLKKEAQDAMLEQVARQIADQNKERDEMERLLHELYQEELEAKQQEEEQLRAEKVEAMKLEMRRANEEMKRVKAERAEQLKREQERFHEEAKKKFEADERYERMSKERARREKAKYFEEINKMVEERQKVFQAALDAELERQRQAHEAELQRLEIIEQERRRLLAEHAAELADYLPKGVFKNMDEMRQYVPQKPARSPQAAAAPQYQARRPPAPTKEPFVSATRPW